MKYFSNKNAFRLAMKSRFGLTWFDQTVKNKMEKYNRDRLTDDAHYENQSNLKSRNWDEVTLALGFTVNVVGDTGVFCLLKNNLKVVRKNAVHVFEHVFS